MNKIHIAALLCLLVAIIIYLMAPIVSIGFIALAGIIELAGWAMLVISYKENKNSEDR